MMLRIGPILIITFADLQNAVEDYAKKYNMLTFSGEVSKKWVGHYAGLILFCRMLFGIKK